MADSTVPARKKEILSTDQAPPAIGPYSQAVLAGGFLFCSGQLPMDPATGQLVGPGMEEQARQALENLRAVLRAGGLGPEDVVKTTVYLVAMEDFAAFNAVYQEYFPGQAPARACVSVKALPRSARVEVEAVARA